MLKKRGSLQTRQALLTEDEAVTGTGVCLTYRPDLKLPGRNASDLLLSGLPYYLDTPF